MISNKRQRVVAPFVLDADALRRLDELLSDETDTERILYRVSLSDGTTMAPGTLDGVLALPNAPKREIESIEVSTTRDANPRASVTFANETFRPITYDLTGEDDKNVALSAKLEDEFAGLRQWYTFAASENFWMALALGFLIPLIIGGVTVAIVEASDSDPEIPLHLAVLTAFISTVLVLLLILAQSRRLFPVGTFAIGQGTQRHQRRKKRRNGIIYAVLITVPLGVLINLLSALLL